MELGDEHGFLEELLALGSPTEFFYSTGGSSLDIGGLNNNLSFEETSAFDCLGEVCWPTSSAAASDAAIGSAAADRLEAENRSKNKSSSSKKKKCKVDGAPSKNLMAERRRRKRLNDRLTMLRSVVPKISKLSPDRSTPRTSSISKSRYSRSSQWHRGNSIPFGYETTPWIWSHMDRTSILGDTIDYMKELLERIKQQQEEIQVGSSDQTALLGMFKELSPSEVLVRSSPKFAVERKRDGETRIEICCAGKPGLLLSTIGTLDAVGLDVQQCVVSCFNDFGMQATCSQSSEGRAMASAEDIKQALFRNAGYGGRCM